MYLKCISQMKYGHTARLASALDDQEVSFFRKIKTGPQLKNYVLAKVASELHGHHAHVG